MKVWALTVLLAGGVLAVVLLPSASGQVCNNGVWEQALGEKCDPTATPSGCAGVCRNTCIICCGNGALDAGEQCDGALMGSVTQCSDLGYAGGAVNCNGCVFDLSTCTDGTPVAAQCGNGIIDAGEDCDWNANLENLAFF